MPELNENKIKCMKIGIAMALHYLMSKQDSGESINEFFNDMICDTEEDFQILIDAILFAHKSEFPVRTN